MKKCAVLIGIIILLGAVVGCSEKTEPFDDENIIFEVVNAQSNNELKSNTIEITNETGFNLDNLSLKISYPSETVNTNNSNAERETVKFIEEFKINSSETKEFSIPFALKAGVEAIDLEIDFKGNVVEGNSKVPFELGGTLSALISTP